MPAITCPYCGTSYTAFQSNCERCGASLPPPVMPALAADGASGFDLLVPPPAPRQISDRYARKLLLQDGAALAGGILALLGGIFFFLGLILTVFNITAFVGIPFVLIGFPLLAGGAYLLKRGYDKAQTTVRVLRDGTATPGEIVSVEQNYAVQINGRNPWVIVYRFTYSGQVLQNEISTLQTPGPELQSGRPAYVLYLPDAPDKNCLFPHP